MSETGNHLKTLRRRRDFLSDRIANYRPDGSPSHDLAERSAIEWAVTICEEAKRRNLLHELAHPKAPA